ncbi:metallothionein [Pseudomonas putida CSV86]|uniref:Metallothionein n=2 Tax=Pseudomonas TaxID=286 RepID=A0A177SJA8_PSEPU|nr:MULTISPECIES: metallothionein [Pseudomonas]NNJ16242.1 metallothionein [Pseudomonas bharatica CSV86]OAI88317.1 metallothionein [Pseudomonas putida]
MSEQHCACPGCTCEVDANAVQLAGEAYCCKACASGHANGEPCRMSECHCGDDKARQPDEEQVDNALEETFPASDPISP